MDAGRGRWRRAGTPAYLVPCLLLVVAAGAEAVWVATRAAPVTPADRPTSLLTVALVAAATTLPLAVLWTQPAAAAVVVTATTVLSLTAFRTLTVAGLVALLAAAYRLGRRGPAALAVGLTAPYPLLALATVRPGLVDWRGETWVLVLLLASLAPAAALAGVARRARADARRAGAARQVVADSLLEHTARGERARIARELHDVVAHHISMVAVQAETARLATPGMPAAGAERLSAIGDTARAALTEMRRLLGVLREDTEQPATRQPQPGLAELADLLDEARDAAGTGVRLVLSGAPGRLDPGVELAAYRIVQEALTNARRHAPGAAVDVELHYGGDALRILVRDDGPGPVAPGGGGHGLSGMRERATAVGGVLRSGAAATGGFLVVARLPGVPDPLGGTREPAGATLGGTREPAGDAVGDVRTPDGPDAAGGPDAGREPGYAAERAG
ncbi:MAG TPA: histidine kinase [Actinocatenispora sp.]